MKACGIITLTTDFSLEDGFVGIMKGAIYCINPQAQIVDITHHISPQNIDAASFIVNNSYKHFPAGTIHVVVVDPGVGSERRILAVAADNYYFIAPDNKILKYIFYKNETLTVVEVLNKRYFNKNVSRTFHGRDIFAPVAAHLSNGVPIEQLGKVITNYDRGEIDTPVFLHNKIIGIVIYIDVFGNLITNIKEEYILNKSFIIKIGTTIFNNLSSSYSDVKISEPLAIIGSSGFVEIAIRNGNAKSLFSSNTGDKVEIVFD